MAALIGLWWAGSVLVGTELVLPSPARVLGEFFAVGSQPEFLGAVAGTFGRGMEAFAWSVVLGLAAGFAAGRSPLFAAALAPLLTTIRATPVLAVILLILIWFKDSFVPVFAAFLMAFPVMTASSTAGARATPVELLEMAELFKVPPARVLLGLRLPAALPHVLSGMYASLGLCWKVVVAGEVIAQPAGAIGTGMQSARSHLETPRVFAWALAAILLCGLTEWLFGLLIRRGSRDGA